MSIIQQNHKIRKWTVGTVLVFFILTQVFGGVFFYAKPAMAQLVVADPVTGAQTTIRNIQDFLKVLVVNAGTMALINAASRFMQKVSYDLAVSLASGGGGQMPLFSTEGWGDYMKSAGLDAAGEFIGSFGDMVGVDFCAPPDPRVGLNLQLSLGSIYSGELPPPTCEWSEISSNWDSFVSEVQSEDFLREMASQFRVSYQGGTDLDLAMTGFIGAFNQSATAERSAKQTREEGQGFLPASEFISGKVKTPAEVIRQTSEIQTKGPVEAEQLKWSLSGQAMSAGAQGMLAMVASTFVSTLLSKTMERVFSKGFYSLADLFPKGDSTTSEGTAWGGRRAAELAFADLLVPQIKEGGSYDVLTDFIVCPDKFKGVNNCVMDGNFEAAVRRAQTGEPLTIGKAIDEGLLHGEWPIIPPSNLAKNQDPYCYTYGYCYSNLVKLRKARIIPIGWEIAAQSQTATEPVSLNEVVDKFRDCNYTDPTYPEGKADAEHKYCHLIDPDWILKAPLGQCRARVYGPLLQTAENSFRQEVCVDTPTCIAEDDKGNCQGGWGYCTREKNIWRLDGDQCDAEYDTCRALTRRDGQNVAYTINTIDYGPPCNADDIGCRWYSDRQSKVGDEWIWQDTLTGSGAAARRNDRIFFNKNVAQCDEPGCNEFLRTTTATRLNLVANSSFENFTGTIDDGVEDAFAPWRVTAASVSPQAVSDTYFGRTAVRLQGTISQTIQLDKPRGGGTFTLSLFAKSCGVSSRFGFDVSDRVRNDPPPSETNWQRYLATATFPDTDASRTIGIVLYNVDMSAVNPCLVDAIQLEEGPSASNYHEGWGTTGEALYLKTAPDYYSCYDYTASGALNKTNDAEQCGNYAAACEEKDVGCEQYTPTNGDPFVPGIANYPDDYCPAECVGYQTFKQVATDFEQDKFPVYFIPATGRTCSAADVGCDQFTSLETEAVANFNYVRRCEKPGATSAAFYTWEGSDTTGYQLKTWSLKISNVLSAPLSDSDPDSGIPPCTALAADGLTCNGLSTVGFCTKSDTLTNPDCREFYDAAGKKHYRLYSKTIVATDDCHPYRKTVSSASDCAASAGKWDTTKSECVYQVYLPESQSCSNEAVGCRAYRGNAGANTAVIFTTNFDDATRNGWSAGDISSESLVVGGKSLTLTSGTTTTKDISTSVRKGGLYTLSFWAKGSSRLDIKFSGASAGRVFSSAGTNPTNLSFDWRFFSLGPVYVDWDISSGETLQITSAGGASPAYLDNIILREVQDYIYMVKNSWATPTSCDSSFTIDSSATDATACTARGGSWSADRNECVLAARLPQAQLGCASYYDRTNLLHYLKSFSRLCPVDVAGCEKLIKTNNDDAVTEEIYNTENDVNNPATPADETQGLSAEERFSDNVTIPADSFTYIVVNDANKCAAQNAGCAEFGSPTLDQAGNVKTNDSGKPMYDTVNLLADPALYNSATGRILCQVGFLSCEEYATTDGGKLYFKDPEPRLCEWKDNVSVSGQNVSGWFKKGIEPLEPCDPANFNGGYYNIWKNGDVNCSLSYVCDSDTGCLCQVGTGGATGKTGSRCTVSKDKRSCPYSGWVGECTPQADKCTKFVDSADTSQSSAGQPYYYINNSKITEGNCNGMVSQREGCVLFNDTSNPQLDKNTNATYTASETKSGDPGGLVAPIDCSQGGDNCKRCLEKILRPPNHEYYWGDFCSADSDCADRFPGESSNLGCQDVANYRYNSPYMILLEKEGTPITVANGSNDSNRLVQVRRDRICGEWLTCSGTNHTFDSQTGREKVLCNEVTACSQYAKVGQATTQCTEQVDRPDTYRQILSKDLYVSRDITFKGMDYSGDSIYNQYQAPDLRGVNIGTDESPVLALVFVDDRCFNDADPAGVVSCATHPSGFCASEINGSRCGDSGKCYNNVCVTNFRGDPFAPGAVLTLDETNAEKTSCRAYPEQSSPFPGTVAIWDEGGNLKSKKAGFTGANVCENGENCECSYKKVSYSGGAVTKYFSESKASADLPAVCTGGSRPGQICDPAAGSAAPLGCGDGGQCVTPQREDTVLGWQGFCLERDTANSINGDPKQSACLTWYPMDQIPGMPDIYNNYPEAGFVSGGFNYYCLQPGLYKNLKSRDAVSCLDASETGECDPGDRNACKQAHCPAGYVTIVGACEEWGPSGDVGGFSYDHTDCVGITYDDCPYKCVPINSYHTTARTSEEISWRENDPCFPDPEHATDKFPALPSGALPQLTSWADGDGLTAIVSSNYRDTKDKRYDDCERKGAAFSAANDSTVDSQYFVGCKEAAQVNKESDLLENQAWTNRLWLKPATSTGPEQFYSIEVPTGSGRTPERIAKLQYSLKTLLDPFGKINQEGRTVDLPNLSPSFPMEVKVCRAGSTGAPALAWSLTSTDPDLTCPSPTEAVPISPTTSSSNEGRPFTLIETASSGSIIAPPCFNNDGCNSSGDICRNNHKCYQSCVSSPCASGLCVSAPRDPNSDIKYCEDIEISAGDGRACGTSGGIWIGECSDAPYAGEKCRVPESCWANLCKEGHCYDRGTEPGSAPLTPTIEDLSLGVDAFKQLFAKIYQIWEWDTVNNKYIEKPTAPMDEDITEKRGTAPGPSGSAWPAPPSIWAITDCVGDKCKPGTPDTVSVNGIDGNGLTSSGSTEPINVVGYGELGATMQFFGSADSNAGPLKKVTVEWGDDRGKVETTGRYKNHLGLGECDNRDFAHSTNACVEDYFYSTHTYLCPSDASTSLSACTSTITTNCFAAICPEDVNAAVPGTGSCCVFKPKVQLKDNWGWCNGTCTGRAHGCYAEDCSPEREGAPGIYHWTDFMGRVIVVPK